MRHHARKFHFILMHTRLLSRIFIFTFFIFFFLFVLFCFFETGSHYAVQAGLEFTFVAQAGLELTLILLPLYFSFFKIYLFLFYFLVFALFIH